MPTSHKNATICATAADKPHAGDLIDAVVSAAALVARADGWVQTVEFDAVPGFLARKHLLRNIERKEIRMLFEDRIRELRHPGGTHLAIQRLCQLEDRRAAGMVLEIANETALADSRLDAREEQMLRLLLAVI